MFWGHPGLFHADTSLIDWYKMACMRDIVNILIRMKSISLLSMYMQIWYTQAFSLKNYCSFNTKSYCSDVWGHHRCPQTLAEICSNMGIWGFRAEAVRGKYPGFILSFQWGWSPEASQGLESHKGFWPRKHVLLSSQGPCSLGNHCPLYQQSLISMA